MKLDRKVVYEIYTDYLKGLRRSKRGMNQQKRTIEMFFDSLRGVGKDDIRDVTGDDILNFVKYLDEYKRQDKRGAGQRLAKRSKQGIFGRLRQIFHYLYAAGFTLHNVFERVDDIDFRGIVTVRKVFSKDEIARFLDCIETDTFYGLRTRVIFELMYSSGLRMMEAARLRVKDIDLDSREAVIRLGKFKKDRVVPISEVVEKFMRKYIERTKHIRGEEGSFFIKSNGEGIGRKGLTHYFNRYIKKCRLGKKGYTIHSVRHACATHLLESGADIRYIQELLGHEKIDTTAKYTHLMIESLKKEYKKHHPRENEYYKEVDEEYLSKVMYLKERILKDREKRKRFKKEVNRN